MEEIVRKHVERIGQVVNEQRVARTKRDTNETHEQTTLTHYQIGSSICAIQNTCLTERSRSTRLRSRIVGGLTLPSSSSCFGAWGG